MYYRLAPAYALRGWQNTTHMLVAKPDNQARPLTATEFTVLVLCDGQTPLDVSCLSATEQAALQELIHRGIVTAHDAPSPITQGQMYRYYDNRFIQRVMWSVTGMCNFRCRHCFVDGPCETTHGLSTEGALALIDQLAACGVMQVELTGGEPLVRPDFLQLLDRMRERGIFVTQIYTNGALVDATFLNELKKRQMQPAFHFSFDGVEGWHDWMRGVAGAEQKTLHAMQLCIDNGYDVYAGMCLHKGNVDSLPNTVKLLADIGVTRLNVSGITMSPLWAQNHSGYAMDNREYLEAAMAYFPRYFQDGRPMHVTLNGAALLHPREKCQTVQALPCMNAEKRYYLCSTARFTPYISPEGRLLPCMPMSTCEEQSYFPLIPEKGLAACLTDSTFMDFASRCTDDLFAHNPECGSCEHRLNCGGGCRASALQESHDYYGCDSYQCLVWKEGYSEKLAMALEKAEADADER